MDEMLSVPLRKLRAGGGVSGVAGEVASETLVASIVARDLAARKRVEEDLRARLAFDALTRDLSARFATLPDRDTGEAIDHSVMALGQFMDLDQVALWELSVEGDVFTANHCWSAGDVAAATSAVRTEQVPALGAQILRGQSVSYSRIDDPSPDHSEDEQFFALRGLRAALAIPVTLGGAVLGAVCFGSMRRPRDWPPEMIERLQLVAHLFGNALARKRSAQAMDAAYAQIKQLTDQLHADNVYLREELNLKFNDGEIVGQSDAIRSVLAQVEQVAGTPATVLIAGETGTGKELLARAIHAHSARKNRPLLMLNCAALPATLVESELFGREKGAYTGALTRQAGRFELADGSTLFLDEVGELPLEVQAKLLRVLQSGEFERLGGTRTLRADVRILAATNRDLEQAVRDGKFRRDLYYRLAVFPIRLPPLRERTDDIPLLVWKFVKEFAAAMGKTIDSIPRHTLERLKSYAWPGNIRELRNVIERSLIVSRSTTLEIDLPSTSVGPPETGMAPAAAESGLKIKEVERRHILAVLEKVGWRVSGPQGAAVLLGLKPTTLESRMAKLEIHRPRSES
jgi:transcriptional regulator with GAF, ATPase, and Fis domain